MYKIEGPEDGGRPGKGPNFLLILFLFGAAILVILGISLIVTGDAGKLIHAVRPNHHMTTQLLAVPPRGELA